MWLGGSCLLHSWSVQFSCCFCNYYACEKHNPTPNPILEGQKAVFCGIFPCPLAALVLLLSGYSEHLALHFIKTCKLPCHAKATVSNKTLIHNCNVVLAANLSRILKIMYIVWTTSPKRHLCSIILHIILHEVWHTSSTKTVLLLF